MITAPSSIIACFKPLISEASIRCKEGPVGAGMSTISVENEIKCRSIVRRKYIYFFVNDLPSTLSPTTTVFLSFSIIMPVRIVDSR